MLSAFDWMLQNKNDKEIQFFTVYIHFFDTYVISGVNTKLPFQNNLF